AGASVRSQSKPARGVREAGPRSVCVGGPSADFLNEPRTALPRTSYLYSASKANRRGPKGPPAQLSSAQLFINFTYVLVLFGLVLHLDPRNLDLHKFSRRKRVVSLLQSG
ncbi:hypothetical protein JG687_00017705, partial [Phytophthora cactorum]